MYKQPGISIIIPSYNSSGYLEETVRTLYEQTNKNIEVIIIDDGSTDNSVEVAEMLLAKFSLAGSVIRRPDTEPKGVASCRNIGVKKASHDWVSFLDSDDLFVADTIQKTIDNIVEYGHESGAFFHGVREFDDETNDTITLKILEFEQRPTDIFNKLINRNFITTSSVTLRKSLIEEIGYFDITLHGVEDYMLWLRVSKRTTWVYCKEVLTEYRVRRSSLMGGRRFQYYLEQNAKLIASIRGTGEFTDFDITSIINYLDATTKYYAMVSIDRWGWSDFINGILFLKRTGKKALAAELLKHHVRNNVLRKISRIIKK